jgi:hypothetical protein
MSTIPTHHFPLAHIGLSLFSFDDRNAVPQVTRYAIIAVIARHSLETNFLAFHVVNWYFQATFSQCREKDATSIAVCTRAGQSTRGSTFIRN